MQFAIYELQDDKSIVLEAVKNNGLALEYASTRLRSDKDVIDCAIGNTATAVLYKILILSPSEQRFNFWRKLMSSLLASILMGAFGALIGFGLSKIKFHSITPIIICASFFFIWGLLFWREEF